MDDIFTFIALFNFSHRQVVIGVGKWTTYLLLLLCSTSVRLLLVSVSDDIFTFIALFEVQVDDVRLLLVSVRNDIFTFIALFDFSHRQVVIGVSK